MMNIIDGKQKNRIKVYENIITTIGWAFMLTFLIQVILSVILWGFNLTQFHQRLFLITNIDCTLNVVFWTLIIGAIGFMVLYVWGRYNFRKYGPLTRRTFPEDSTASDVAKLFDVPEGSVENMQNSRIIILDKTIV